MYSLFDNYSGFPVLIGVFSDVDEARNAARKLEESSRGKFFPQIVKDGKVLQNWTF